MPWRELSLMDQRKEFVRLFQQPDVNRRELCRRSGVALWANSLRCPLRVHLLLSRMNLPGLNSPAILLWR